MSRDLRCDHVRDQLLARTHHGGRSFITGAFNAENVGVSHASILVEGGPSEWRQPGVAVVEWLAT